MVYGAGTGPNGSRINVWMEWKLLYQDIAQNTSSLEVYFYACLEDGYSSDTWGSGGATAKMELYDTDINDWWAIAEDANSSYDFRSTSHVNDFDLGSASLLITHSEDGVNRNKLRASFTTPSSYITGGYVAEFTPALPAIPRGFHVKTGGAWHNSIAYARIGGVWRQCLVYGKVGGIWKLGQ